MPSAYIFCPSDALNIKNINVSGENDVENIYIAADSGIKTAKILNKIPDIIIGDFDSFDLNGYKNSRNTKIIKYPAEKDETDSMLAVKYALENGYKNIAVIGGLGGRIDHTLANLFLLKYIKNRGGNGYISDGYNKITYLENSKCEIYKKYKYISIIPAAEKISGVSLIGFKYPLTEASVSSEEPYTVCNEILESRNYGEIEIKYGGALICECDDM